MPDKKDVKRQLKKAGHHTLGAQKITTVLNEDETLLASCSGKSAVFRHLITNKRFLTLKNLSPYYECPHKNIDKIYLALEANTLRLKGKDGFEHEIVLGKPKKARNHYLEVIDRGLPSKIEQVSSFNEPPKEDHALRMARVTLIEPLGDKGEQLLLNNMHPSEKIIVKLKGRFGEAFVITNQRIYILKWGFQTKHALGGESTAYEFKSITGLQLNNHFRARYVEVLSPANRSKPGLKSTNATETNYAVPFEPSRQAAAFQEAVNIGRQLINDAHKAPDTSTNSNSLEQLEKLADLKDKGIISKEEFLAKKKQILGL